MNRGDLTDAQWEQFRPLLPPLKVSTGRPAKDHRLILEGILWIDRTWAPWPDLPECNARRRGINVTIPRKRSERRRGSFDRAAYRARNLVERPMNRCKRFRRLATRYEKRSGTTARCGSSPRSCSGSDMAMGEGNWR